MFKHFLIATDGSPQAEKALAQGLTLAKALSAKVTIATVTEPWTEAAYPILPTPSLVHSYEKAAAGKAAVILDRSKKAADLVGVQCVTRHIIEHVSEGIIKVAKDEGCDLIVVGSHGRGTVGRILLGSDSLEILTFSTVPVLVCR